MSILRNIRQSKRPREGAWVTFSTNRKILFSLSLSETAEVKEGDCFTVEPLIVDGKDYLRLTRVAPTKHDEHDTLKVIESQGYMMLTSIELFDRLKIKKGWKAAKVFRTKQGVVQIEFPYDQRKEEDVPANEIRPEA